MAQRKGTGVNLEALAGLASKREKSKEPLVLLSYDSGTVRLACEGLPRPDPGMVNFLRDKPQGNHLFAFALKDAIAEWLDPKPVAYRKGGETIRP